MFNSIKSILKHNDTVIILCVGLALLVGALSLFDNRGLNRIVVDALIYVILVVGLYIFVGNSGVLSFGHMGFMTIGAYASAWQTCCPNLKPYTMPGLPSFLLDQTYPVFPAAVVAGLLTAVVALVVGIALMRLSGFAASIGTFAFLIIINEVYSNWDSVTGGTSSIIGIPKYVTIWVALGWALLTIVVAFLYQRSRFGLALRTSRENAIAAQSAGVNIFNQRLLAFGISAFFVGIGGALYGSFLGVITPDVFYQKLPFFTIVMLVVGGINSLTGAVVGVVSLSFFTELLKEVERGVTLGDVEFALPGGAQEIGLGVIMLLILVFRKGGITKNQEIRWPWK